MRGLRQIRVAALLFAITAGGLVPQPALSVLCPAPGAFEQGRIRGLWVGVLLNFAGEAGSPHTATVYMTGLNASGITLMNLGTVQAQGDGAAELHAMFVATSYILRQRSLRSGITG
jgi:hypothetical protein